MRKKTVSAIICAAFIIMGWYQKGNLLTVSHTSTSSKNSAATSLGNSTVTSENVEAPSTSKLASMTYHGTMVVRVNNDVPSFKASDMTTKTYIKLSKLDSLGYASSPSVSLKQIN